MLVSISSSRSACATVRGKPSRMKLGVGHVSIGTFLAEILVDLEVD